MLGKPMLKENIIITLVLFTCNLIHNKTHKGGKKVIFEAGWTSWSPAMSMM